MHVDGHAKMVRVVLARASCRKRAPKIHWLDTSKKKKSDMPRLLRQMVVNQNQALRPRPAPLFFFLSLSLSPDLVIRPATSYMDPFVII